MTKYNFHSCNNYEFALLVVQHLAIILPESCSVLSLCASYFIIIIIILHSRLALCTMRWHKHAGIHELEISHSAQEGLTKFLMVSIAPIFTYRGIGGSVSLLLLW